MRFKDVASDRPYFCIQLNKKLSFQAIIAKMISKNYSD